MTDILALHIQWPEKRKYSLSGAVGFPSHSGAVGFTLTFRCCRVYPHIQLSGAVGFTLTFNFAVSYSSLNVGVTQSFTHSQTDSQTVSCLSYIIQYRGYGTIFA